MDSLILHMYNQTIDRQPHFHFINIVTLYTDTKLLISAETISVSMSPVMKFHPKCLCFGFWSSAKAIKFAQEFSNIRRVLSLNVRVELTTTDDEAEMNIIKPDTKTVRIINYLC